MLGERSPSPQHELLTIPRWGSAAWGGSVMNDRDDLTDLRGDRIATTEVRLEGFYWVILGQNPPEIAYWERGEWWLAGEPRPWHPEAVTVVSDRLVFKPKLVPVA
jgi:hypothetical protein